VLQAISEGKMNPGGMITKTIKLDHVEDEGFRTLIEDKENHVKILVDVGAGLS
jgi:threonine dehydrogenase-like Zn-dependent dehydrogenase